MSFGYWKCQVCGHEEGCLIYRPLDKCPQCGAEYEIVELIFGAHVAHSIPVQRLKGSKKRNVAKGICFMQGRDPSAVERYTKACEESR